MHRSLALALIAATPFVPQAAAEGQERSAVRGDSVIVIVRQAKGAALVAANIQYRTSDTLATGRFDARTSTDEQGRAAFPRPKSDTTTIRVRAIGFAPQTHSIRLDTARGPLRIELQLDTVWIRAFSPDPPSGPVGRIRLAVREPRREQGRNARALVFSMYTERQFGCLGYGIAHSFERRGNTLRIVLLGISGPGGVCPTAVGPAEANLAVNLDAGRYSVVVEAQPDGKIDRLRLEVTDSSFKLVGQQLSFITPDERLWWRYPERVMALTCEGEEIRVRPVCDDFRRWLATRAGISVHRFGPAGVNPFWPDTLSRDRRFWTFRVSDDRALTAVWDCLSEVNLQIQEAVGVGLGIETWKGDRYSIFSRRSFHERHIEIPQRVTAGPSCSRD